MPTPRGEPAGGLPAAAKTYADAATVNARSTGMWRPWILRIGCWRSASLARPDPGGSGRPGRLELGLPALSRNALRLGTLSRIPQLERCFDRPERDHGAIRQFDRLLHAGRPRNVPLLLPRSSRVSRRPLLSTVIRACRRETLDELSHTEDSGRARRGSRLPSSRRFCRPRRASNV